VYEEHGQREGGKGGDWGGGSKMGKSAFEVGIEKGKLENIKKKGQKCLFLREETA